MADGCPSLELLCVYIDCNVTPEERAFVERHLIECDSCLDLVAEVIKSKRDIPDPVLPPVEGRK
jgi:hypothetical protein